jgi:two-component system response regulator HydG
MTEEQKAWIVHPEPKKRSAAILVVDDDLPICRVLKEFLTSKGFVTRTVHLAEEALWALNEIEFDLVITNIRMPGIDGILLTRLVRRWYASDVIIMTGYHEFTIKDAARAGAVDLLHKPVKLTDLLNSVNIILGR